MNTTKKSKTSNPKHRNSELVEFVHEKTKKMPDGTIKGVGPLVGCVLARRVRFKCRKTGKFKSGVSVSWSKVNRSSNDVFDKGTALSIARGRAMTGAEPSMPSGIAPVFNRMVDRASRYFKNISFV